MNRIFLIVSVVTLLSGIEVFSQDIPKRNSTKVKDVTQPYAPSEWIVAEKEEPKGDQTVKNAPECDIKAIISCYDDNQLRFDILLHNPIENQVATWFGIKLGYENNEAEYYVYYTDSKEFWYLFEKDGEIVNKEQLDNDIAGDFVGITNSGKVENSDVAIIIDKEKHIAGDKGKTYFITCNFESGYVDGNDQIQTADTTMTVDVRFIK